MQKTDVTEGEPIALDIIINGRGNLDNLAAPKMADPDGWKIYDATQVVRGEERRNVSGTVVFNQFIRPLEMKSAVPSFELSFFNPDTERYETARTEPIALKMTPAAGGAATENTGPPQSLPMPVERMTDILGIVSSGDSIRQKRSPIPFWVFHVIAALVAVSLLLRAIWMRYSHLFKKDRTKAELRQDFAKVSAAISADAVQFLRKAGAFAELHLPSSKSPQIQSILEERDAVCFRPDVSSPELPTKRRREILTILRKAAFAFAFTSILILTLFPQNLMAAEAAEIDKVAPVEAYASSDYAEAAKLWLAAAPYEDLSADILYNIGNAAYRMGAPGEAALYYRRALSRQATHQEAQQNLRFIERKYGSITFVRPDYQYMIGGFSLSTYQSVLWTGTWLGVISLLIFGATYRGSRWRIAGLCGLILGPILMSAGALGSYYYPNDAKFAPLAKQGVIVGENVVLHSDAARTSPEIIDAPPGSLAEIISTRGRWSYISFATQTRGWVLSEFIKKVIPTEKPSVPKVRKAASDGSSA